MRVLSAKKRKAGQSDVDGPAFGSLEARDWCVLVAGPAFCSQKPEVGECWASTDFL